MNFPKVAVVILNWNGRFFLEQFLSSVYNSSYPNLEVVVGDNASSDDSLEFVRENFPKVSIIENDQNYGFAGGYNRVLSQVSADYFVLLNSDVEVSPHWIEPVIRLMESDPTIAAAQPKLRAYHHKHLFEYAGAAGGFIDRFGYPFCRGRIFDEVEQDHTQYNTATEIFWASGAALFIRTDKWFESGGLDADFFAHQEEIDLCWRLKNSGYKIMYCPESVVYHVGGGTLNAESPFKTYLNFRNNLVMIQKNMPAFRAYVVIAIRFVLDFLSLIKFVIDGKTKNAKAISKAHVNFLRNFRKNHQKRLKSFDKINTAGWYRGSIVFDFFVLGKRVFSKLKF